MSIELMGRQSRLSRRLDALIQQALALDPLRDAASMRDQVIAGRPDFAANLKALNAASGHPIGDDQIAQSLTASACIAIVLIKNLPKQIDQVTRLVNSPQTTSAHRCALLGMLGYLGNDRDLIPDDAPGGYGLLDDAVLASACIQELNDATSGTSNMTPVIAWLSNYLPVTVVTQLNLVLQGLSILVQTMSALPSEIADATCLQILDAPTVAAPTTIPPAWTPPSYLAPKDGHWNHGTYFEGGNVIAPGGVSLIDGKLSLPT